MNPTAPTDWIDVVATGPMGPAHTRIRRACPDCGEGLGNGLPPDQPVLLEMTQSLPLPCHLKLYCGSCQWELGEMVWQARQQVH